MSTVAEVRLWGRTIAAVSVDGPQQVAEFEYVDAFSRSGIEVAPLAMPLDRRVHRFPELPIHSFHGLPGLLADSLPDKFGNAVIDAWLATQGRLPNDLDAVERLCYTGTRAMGALEFHPARGPRGDQSTPLEIDALVQLASDVLRRRAGLQSSLASTTGRDALNDILQVGASAGGARAKAVIAWNPTTNAVRSGQVRAPNGFEYWLLKFDGVSGNADRDLDDPVQFCAIEYAYSLMARAANIRMTECRLFEEGDRRHFMTRRFDRTSDGEKLHMQSLGAIAHFDFNSAGTHSYEQALTVIRRLGLGIDAIEEQFRRMVFNIIARNQDDHVKNIAFLMDPRGQWSLSPAFDVMYAYNQHGAWTSSHQMSAASKRDHFTRADLKVVAASASMGRRRADDIIDEVSSAVSRWPEFATRARVAESQIEAIRKTYRLDLARG